MTFNISTVNSPQTIDLFSNYSVLGMVFNSTGSTLIRPSSTQSNSITIGASGINIAPGAGPVTISAHGVSTAGRPVVGEQLLKHFYPH